uniref:Uncharacterized protein n=1 Tax=Pyxicephalus adspersus TaxID=30357 RepID=A0AAV2ZSX4_PYXAD|nr:TPA: hypothetical protein GDO54_004258 [Pyxicephalus adspersus]
MIDKSDTEEGKRLDPTHCIITSPSTTCCLMKTSLAIHNSVRMKRTFTPLPITLKHQNSLDKTLHKAALHPSKEEFRPTQKKGFSSITITARRYIASLSHAPKEIITDPASFLCRSNDLIMKASVPSDEHDLQCRYLDRPEYYTRASEPCGFLHSQELPQQPRTTLKYVNAIHKKNSRTFISGIHIKKADMFARSIYYIDKSFFLPLGQVANPEIYKSTMSFKIQPRPGKPITKNGCESLRLPAYTLCQYLTMPAMEGNNKCKKDQTHSPKPIPETQVPNPMFVVRKKENSQQGEQLLYNIQVGTKEALKYYRPDFICNSQGRVHKLEVMARLRKTQNQEAPNSRLSAKQIHLKKKVFTVPHPLSG